MAISKGKTKSTGTTDSEQHPTSHKETTPAFLVMK